MLPIREIHNLDQSILNNITNSAVPVVIRDFVKNWPAVLTSSKCDQSTINYIKNFDINQLVDILIIPEEQEGKMFYNSAMTGFNFEHRKAPLNALLEQILIPSNKNAIACQSAPIKECLPGFEKDNQLGLLSNISPRIWIGNKITVPTHYDDSHNIACVVSGKRKFTLFPPEQIHNLYIGPLDFAPTGAAISMVDLSNPNLSKHPKFTKALESALFSELGPGDAIYIPPLWWHGVESMCDLNILVNYWWGGSIAINSDVNSAYDCLLHSFLNIKHLPIAQRRAWREFFDYYIFQLEGDNHKHLPESKLGVLGDISQQKSDSIKKWLTVQLKK